MSLSGQCSPVENFHTSVGAFSSAPVACTVTRPLPRLSATSIASTTRARSALEMRKRSATTSSTLRGPVGVATSRSACTRVKPLADSHCVTSSAVVPAGSSTGKVMTMRGSPAAAARSAICA
ncbi:hypothetical protein D3C72_1524900 [compost metagenome]